MTKNLIAGLATIAIAGSALVATGMYASTATSISTLLSRTQWIHMDRQTPEQMVASLSGKVSPGAITEFTTLMAKHKTEMDALRTNTGTTIDKATMEAAHTAFKMEMDTLMVKYPDLKAALPTPPQGGKMGGRGNNPMDQILASVSASDKTTLEAIHTEYEAKEEALRTEERAKIDAIMAKYPDLMAKIDTLRASEKNRGGDHDGDRGGHGPRGR